mgnify:FL=1
MDQKSTLPGRLGDPNLVLTADPRLDPRLRQALLATPETTEGQQLTGIDENSSYEDCLTHCAAMEAAQMQMFSDEVAVPAGITRSTESITGVDGNEILLHVHRPTGTSNDLPCLVDFHGGGMVMLSTTFPPFVRWRDSLAAAGTVVIGVEFRNAAGLLGNHPFPTGLNDCCAAARWVHTQKQYLGISTLVLSGASGGSNLALATTLRAKQEGWLDEIDGVYAMCPYISGAYASKPAQLLSLHENNGYVINLNESAGLAKLYTPDESDNTNPLAWPYYAKSSDLEGLPPHFISVNELDPLRDEGIAYYRNLLSAGVPAICRTIPGSTHGSDVMFRDLAPDTYMESERSVVGFVKSLSAND